MDILKKIVIAKKKEIEIKKRRKSIDRLRKESLAYLKDIKNRKKRRSLTKALAGSGSISIIAEIKLGSPLKGRLTELSCDNIAKKYSKSSADVISVLTDEAFFQGHLSYLKKVRKICHQPIFRKDFIIDPYQIYETLLAGGDAFLLIAAILTDKELASFMRLGSKLGLEYLIEIHDEADLKKALRMGAEIIGINNRNLKTMQIDLNTTRILAKQIPKGKIIISESGVNTQEDVKKIIKAGARGILVGTSIIRSKDMIKKINEFKQ